MANGWPGTRPFSAPATRAKRFPPVSSRGTRSDSATSAQIDEDAARHERRRPLQAEQAARQFDDAAERAGHGAQHGVGDDAPCGVPGLRGERRRTPAAGRRVAPRHEQDERRAHPDAVPEAAEEAERQEAEQVDGLNHGSACYFGRRQIEPETGRPRPSGDGALDGRIPAPLPARAESAGRPSASSHPSAPGTSEYRWSPIGIDISNETRPPSSATGEPPASARTRTRVFAKATGGLGRETSVIRTPPASTAPSASVTSGSASSPAAAAVRPAGRWRRSLVAGTSRCPHVRERTQKTPAATSARTSDADQRRIELHRAVVTGSEDPGLHRLDPSPESRIPSPDATSGTRGTPRSTGPSAARRCAARGTSRRPA